MEQKLEKKQRKNVEKKPKYDEKQGASDFESYRKARVQDVEVMTLD